MRWSVVERRTPMRWSFYHLILSQKLVTLSSFAFYCTLVCLFTHDLDTQNVQYCNILLGMSFLSHILWCWCQVKAILLTVETSCFIILLYQPLCCVPTHCCNMCTEANVTQYLWWFQFNLLCPHMTCSFCLHIEILLLSLSWAELAHNPTTNALLFIFLVELIVIP